MVPGVAGGAFCPGIVRVVVMRHSACAVNGDGCRFCSPSHCLSGRYDWEPAHAAALRAIIQMLLDFLVVKDYSRRIVTSTQVKGHGQRQYPAVGAVPLFAHIHHVDNYRRHGAVQQAGMIQSKTSVWMVSYTRTCPGSQFIVETTNQ